ncbi:PRTRC system protein E [Cupriavidus basilensis]|uniref:PRTRC system protein E n=1 Tax=Cupriavidus basilensis TaxID=68895 RepID=A0ABT6AG90_9BURK|nr:PRTRC system protein E [Cupriavidus basilensis]MDF3831433.1 PRTRC system protein E [Cupriavidus basilensis]
MTMFEELFALATGATLTMTVSADEKTGRMTVNVIPKPKKDVAEPALTKALSLTATPQEFDAGFVEALQGYREVRQSLAEQAEATKEVLEAAKVASVKKATDATTKATTANPPVAAHKPAATATGPTVCTTAADDATDTADRDEGEDGAPAQPALAGSGDSYDLFG